MRDIRAESDVSADLVSLRLMAYRQTHSCTGAETTHWRVQALHVSILYIARFLMQ